MRLRWQQKWQQQQPWSRLSHLLQSAEALVVAASGVDTTNLKQENGKEGGGGWSKVEQKGWWRRCSGTKDAISGLASSDRT